MSSLNSLFAECVVNRLKTALPEIKSVRWLHNLEDIPPLLVPHEVYAWIASEQAEPPRLLNSDRQVIRVELAVAIVLAKTPRSIKQDDQTSSIKNKLRSALEGWIVPQSTQDQSRSRFLPMRLVGGAPLTTRSGGVAKLWIERLACRQLPLG